ncbi:BnaA04g11610D [Brassica napus]|uniref:(rape) hypothetical protein n=1 Tax=Brassica napus TaxID=3708 RepID=A0A078FND2_BRANA|nr:unnamed protein product [Brassica napus]CDY15950.1 BnaA04g11610D [Brassica napus]
MKPLIGVWVNQVPELGNVVYVMPGFLSVVGCRIIPQEGGPLGIQEGRITWSPVFEIISGFDGSTKFFLHGRGKGGCLLYPGPVTGIEKSCNNQMHKFGRYWENMNLEDDEFCYNLAQGDLNKNWEKSSAYFHGGCVACQSFISSGDTFFLSLKAFYSEESLSRVAKN